MAWDYKMEIDKNNVNLLTETFFSKLNTIIDEHMPVKKIKAEECKQQLKPCITQTILAEIKTKIELYQKLVVKIKR